MVCVWTGRIVMEGELFRYGMGRSRMKGPIKGLLRRNMSCLC
jgi:hypothetical protein